MEVNSAAAGSEFEACMRPITYFIAAKFIEYSAPTACFHRDLPLKIVRVDAAATSAHAHHPTRALQRDSSRAILQLDIATGRHRDLEIDSAQTKLEDAPVHAA